MSDWVYFAALALGVPFAGWASEQPWMARLWRVLTHPLASVKAALSSGRLG